MVSVLKQAVWRYDVLGWLLVILFFLLSAFFNDRALSLSLIGAIGVIGLMFIIGLSVEVIIETIKDMKGLGTITGLLTNLPEALVVIVGLVNNDLLFANSTPLGSNFINPIVLILGALLLKCLIFLIRIYPIYTMLTLLGTLAISGIFFYLPIDLYPYWLGALLLITIPLFIARPSEVDEDEALKERISRWWFFPAIIILTVCGYYLDPMVSFASEASSAPKGLIGFGVLAFLSSWPEFKTIFGLINREKYSAGLLNILISNIVNLWLAGAGLVLFWIFA